MESRLELPVGSDPLALNITGSIFSGNSFNGDSVTFNGGVNSISPTYTPSADEAGGNDVEVHFLFTRSVRDAEPAAEIDDLGDNLELLGRPLFD